MKLKSINTLKTASRCTIPVSRQFAALSNNPVKYSQIMNSKTVSEYHLNNPVVNNNGAEENGHTEIQGEKLYINNSHLNKKRDSGSQKFEPTVYSVDDDVHTNAGNVIR